MGPALTAENKAAGMSDSTALSRAAESRVSSVSRASVGESWLACSSETAWWRRFMDGLLRNYWNAIDYHGCVARQESCDTPQWYQAGSGCVAGLIDLDCAGGGCLPLCVFKGCQGGVARGRQFAARGREG